MSTISLGIDIGATNIRYGILSGEKLKKTTSAKTSAATPETLATQCLNIVEELNETGTTGIVMPGPLDSNGVLHSPPNLAGWGEVNFRDVLQKTLGRPFVLDRDSVGALVGEWKLGVARGSQNFVLLTIGTGIGGAAVIDGKILREHHGFSGEFGHALVGPSGRKCGLGHDGCAEAWASGRAIENGVSPDQATDVFARLLKSIELIFDPELIVLSGGIGADRGYVDQVIAKAKSIGLQTVVDRAKLGQWSGVAGAALLGKGDL